MSSFSLSQSFIPLNLSEDKGYVQPQNIFPKPQIMLPKKQNKQSVSNDRSVNVSTNNDQDFQVLINKLKKAQSPNDTSDVSPPFSLWSQSPLPNGAGNNFLSSPSNLSVSPQTQDTPSHIIDVEEIENNIISSYTNSETSSNEESQSFRLPTEKTLDSHPLPTKQPGIWLLLDSKKSSSVHSAPSDTHNSSLYPSLLQQDISFSISPSAEQLHREETPVSLQDPASSDLIPNLPEFERDRLLFSDSDTELVYDFEDAVDKVQETYVKLMNALNQYKSKLHTYYEVKEKIESNLKNKKPLKSTYEITVQVPSQTNKNLEQKSKYGNEEPFLLDILHNPPDPSTIPIPLIFQNPNSTNNTKKQSHNGSKSGKKNKKRIN